MTLDRSRCADERLEPQPPGAAQRRPGDRDLGQRHRHRHPARKAEADLRGVPAGRRNDQPQIWRHRPRPVDQPRDRAPARAASSRSSRSPSKGSTFTLFIPLEAAAVAAPETFAASGRDAAATTPSTCCPPALEVTDDRDSLGKSPFVLIVEDDVTFASILLDLAREAGLKGVVSTDRLGHGRAWRASFSPTRSRSTSGSTTSTASSCSTCCSTMPRPRKSRSTSSAAPTRRPT